jgi:hypothetical protein
MRDTLATISESKYGQNKNMAKLKNKSERAIVFCELGEQKNREGNS